MRNELRARGMIGKEERERRLVPLQWSEAERADRRATPRRRRSCSSTAIQSGSRPASASAPPRCLKKRRSGNAANFATYGEGTIKLAKNDLIRTTAKGKTLGRQAHGGQRQRVHGEGF